MLTTCPECKQQISDQADSCPHCGSPEIRRPRFEADVLRARYMIRHTVATFLTFCCGMGVLLFTIASIAFALTPSKPMTADEINENLFTYILGGENNQMLLACATSLLICTAIPIAAWKWAKKIQP